MPRDRTANNSNTNNLVVFRHGNTKLAAHYRLVMPVHGLNKRIRLFKIDRRDIHLILQTRTYSPSVREINAHPSLFAALLLAFITFALCDTGTWKLSPTNMSACGYLNTFRGAGGTIPVSISNFSITTSSPRLITEIVHDRRKKSPQQRGLTLYLRRRGATAHSIDDLPPNILIFLGNGGCWGARPHPPP